MPAGKGAADDEPRPGNLLLNIDAPHVLPVGTAGLRITGRVAVIDADSFSWMLKLKVEQFLRRELKVDRRLGDVMQRMRLLNQPVPLLVHLARQQPARLYL